MRKKVVVYLMVLSISSLSFGQSIKDTSLLMNMFSFHVSGHVPGGAIAQRYGMNMGVGGSYMLKLASGWMLAADFTFFSGNDFKADSVFDAVRDEYGDFINTFAEIGEAAFYERGFYTGLRAGKLFPIIGPNPNSGIVVLLSGGLLQYKTLIHQDGREVPYILEDYSKGYDRLTNGFGLSQFIGYLHLDSHEPINFYVGFEFHQAWTKNRRDWNFDSMEKDLNLYNDYLFGIRFGWIFPINKNTVDTYYYY